jgi:glutaredoxin
MKRVTLYTKPGCHLCENALREIEAVRREIPFELELRNILDDDEDFAKYELDIPVITLDGREIARHRVTSQQLREALAD